MICGQMKLMIGQEELNAGLQSVQNVVSTRTTLPILSNVLLKAEGNSLSLTATDLDVTISNAVEAKVELPGSFTLPVKKLVSIAREMGGSQIELEVKGILRTNKMQVCLREKNREDLLPGSTHHDL